MRNATFPYPTGDARRARRGIAAVEFALVAPVLFAVILGMIELGRALMVSEILTTAAHTGCRAGTLPGTGNTNINTALGNTLPGISGWTSTIKVNGNVVDASTAISGDTISVQVSVPYGNVSWLKSASFLSGATLSATAVMARE